MRWVALLLLLPGCMGTQECHDAWGLALDQDLYAPLIELGATVERPHHTLGGAGFPGYHPQAALVEVRWKPLEEPVGGNARPHLALYAEGPEVALKDGDALSRSFLLEVTKTFMPSDDAARELVDRLLASPVDGHMDFRAQAPGAILEASDVEGSKSGGSSGTGFWTEHRRAEHRYELSWRGPTAGMEASHLAVMADNRGNAFVTSWAEKPGPEVHEEIQEAFAAVGLPDPDFSRASAVPAPYCTTRPLFA